MSTKNGVARSRAWPLVMILATWWLCLPPSGAAADELAPEAQQSTNREEHLEYSVRWLGLRCGVMTIHSAPAPGDDDIRVIILNARTSRFFDRIHRVRIRIESRSSIARGSTTYYHRVHEEEDSNSEEEIEIDERRKTIIHREDGHHRSFPLERSQPLDPLAYLYRLRTLLDAPGDSVALNLVTAQGPAETTARVHNQSTTRTSIGRVEVLHVFPEAPDGAMFRQSGQIEMWVGTDPAGTLHRIEFKLPLGTLVAVLKDRHLPSEDP